MTERPSGITGSADCGNSPKNAVVQAIAIALESGMAEAESFDPSVTWERASGGRITGRAALLDTLAAAQPPKVLVVEHAISHGKVGAASGQAIMADGERRRFSHVLEFKNNQAKAVASIKSYG